MGCCRQKLTGDGVAFLNATGESRSIPPTLCITAFQPPPTSPRPLARPPLPGTVVKKSLSDGEVLVVDTNSLVAWDAGVGLGVQATGGMCVACFGGEGCCNTTLKGPGDVWVQSMNLGKLKRSMRVDITMRNQGGGAPVDHESMVR